MLKQTVAAIIFVVTLLTFTACSGEKEADMKDSYTYQMREIHCEREKLDIYGIAYIPNTNNKVPLVIFSHEIGSTHSSGTDYARSLASCGIAVYTFDFCGGSYASRSNGAVTDMSVMTEAADLESVIDASKTWDFVDTDKIMLLGASQGGMVSSVVATRRADEIAGLMLLYPAFVIQDDMYEMFSSEEDVTERFSLFGWMTLGRKYATDIWNYDVFGEMKKYTKPVLIIHGNRDGIVPLPYAQRAADSYPNARLVTIDGAGHGFYGNSYRRAITEIYDYIDRADTL